MKDTGADNEGLLEFYTEYFDRHPMYLDEDWKIYKAMGGKSVSIGNVLKAVFVSSRRWKAKGISHSAKNSKATEGWMTGGVLVFNKKGELVYFLEEQVGEPFDMDQLKAAIDQAREGQSSELKDKSARNGSDRVG